MKVLNGKGNYLKLNVKIRNLSMYYGTVFKFGLNELNLNFFIGKYVV